MEELKTMNIGILAPLLAVLGFIGIVVGIVLAAVLWEDIWMGIVIDFAISGLCFVFGLTKLILKSKKRKTFSSKYDIDYYFK